MKQTNKIRAFTLSEMLVVLAITGILVGLAFAVLQLVQKQMQGIRMGLEYQTEISVLERTIWVDFHTYSEAQVLEDRLVLTHPLESLEYRLLPPYILRRADTLAIRLQEGRYYFQGKRVSQGPIDALQLILTRGATADSLWVYGPQALTPQMKVHGF